MKQYIKALQHVLEKGKQREDRTGVGTRGVFGYQMRFDLRNSFPAVQQRSWPGKALSANYFGFWRELQMKEGLQKYISENQGKT